MGIIRVTVATIAQRGASPDHCSPSLQMMLHYNQGTMSNNDVAGKILL